MIQYNWGKLMGGLCLPISRSQPPRLIETDWGTYVGRISQLPCRPNRNRTFIARRAITVDGSILPCIQGTTQYPRHHNNTPCQSTTTLHGNTPWTLGILTSSPQVLPRDFTYHHRLETLPCLSTTLSFQSKTFQHQMATQLTSYKQKQNLYWPR